MQLLTRLHINKLLANGAKVGADHLPVVKFFSPVGSGTWLFTEMAADGDTLFGLCDMGAGEPELGYASLSELATIRLRFGLGIERDVSFTGDYPLSVYTAAARCERQITTNPAVLDKYVLSAVA